MKIARPQSIHQDERGEITDIFVKEEVEYITLITSVRGSTRGNHYHEKTFQWVYVLQGRLRLLTQMPDTPVDSAILEKGDLALTMPLERHAMEALEDSIFMVFTRGPRGGEDYETDTYRLSEPLRQA